MVRELAQCVGVLQEEAGDVLGDGVGGMVDELFGFHSVGNGCRAFLGVDVWYLVVPFVCVCVSSVRVLVGGFVCEHGYQSTQIHTKFE